MELKYYSVLENRIVNLEEQFKKNENMTSEQRQNIWGFRWNSKSRLRRKHHQNLQRLRYHCITYGYCRLSHSSSRKKHNQHNETINCEIYWKKKTFEAMLQQKKILILKVSFCKSLIMPVQSIYVRKVLRDLQRKGRINTVFLLQLLWQ